ncbi:MAG: diadenylate cyclase [Myxococcales bacterium]|jgi:DNA integrity scanning protein DisA with diadenylate cyclase activity|nr:diadenylate cyclase [Myxococcales bacterium]
MHTLDSFDHDLLNSVLTLAEREDVDRLLIISDVQILSPEALRACAARKKLIFATASDNLRAVLATQQLAVVRLPAYSYDRVEKVKVALVAAASENMIQEGNLVLCITGVGEARSLDAVFKVHFGKHFDRPSLSIDTMNLGAEFKSQVVEALIRTALAIGEQGYEGRSVGTLITVGDATAVMEKSRQLILNPFQGMSEAERNVLDPNIREAIKTFAFLDGAFVVREDGVVLTAGRYLQASGDRHHQGKAMAVLPMGLGARHAAASAITVDTKAIAISVSQTSGTVRVFRDGEIILELAQSARRQK